MEKRLCFTPKYIHFVYSYAAYVAFIFLLVFAVRISVLFFFSHTGARGHVVVMINDPFRIFHFFGSEESK